MKLVLPRITKHFLGLIHVELQKKNRIKIEENWSKEKVVFRREIACKLVVLNWMGWSHKANLLFETKQQYETFKLFKVPTVKTIHLSEDFFFAKNDEHRYIFIDLNSIFTGWWKFTWSPWGYELSMKAVSTLNWNIFQRSNIKLRKNFSSIVQSTNGFYFLCK